MYLNILGLIKIGHPKSPMNRPPVGGFFIRGLGRFLRPKGMQILKEHGYNWLSRDYQTISLPFGWTLVRRRNRY